MVSILQPICSPLSQPTFAGPPGPSNFAICSFACFGRSTVFVLARPRHGRKDDIADNAKLSVRAMPGYRTSPIDPVIYDHGLATKTPSINFRGFTKVGKKFHKAWCSTILERGREFDCLARDKALHDYPCTWQQHPGYHARRGSFTYTFCRELS